MKIGAVLMIALSCMFSTGRSVFLKEQSFLTISDRHFWHLLSFSFLAGALPMLFFDSEVSWAIVLLAVIYAILLIVVLANLKKALQNGNMNICTIVYAMGFIFPTIAGMLFWHEEVALFKIIGIMLAVVVIFVSGSKKVDEKKGENYIIPLIISMLSNGGLGIMQKLFRSVSSEGDESSFIRLAFLFGSVICFGLGTLVKKESLVPKSRDWIFAGLTGICFSMTSFFNILLLAMVEGSVLFPVLNVGTLIFGALGGVIIFKEHFTVRSVCSVVLGVATILIINL